MISAVLEALALPPDARVERRIPKKMLQEQGAPTAGDKRHIQDGIEELVWTAALKPTTISVPDYRDAMREYLEIAVLSVTLRSQAKAPRLMELIHRAIPYPVVLLATQGNALTLSLAHKRWSQGETGKVVLDGGVVIADLIVGASTREDFLASLPLTDQPRLHLFALYQGWIERLEALDASRITGAFTLAETPEAAEARRAALAEYVQIQKEIALLHAQVARETQLNRRVELNLKIKQLEQKRVAVIKTVENRCKSS